MLSYFALTDSLEMPLRIGADLSAAEFSEVVQIARLEDDSLRRLFLSTQSLIVDPSLSMAAKRSQIEQFGYNERVDMIVYATNARLRDALENATYFRLISWIEARWPVEQALHGRPDMKIERSGAAVARSYQIFATRYESKGGAYTVALPDQCLKLANGGLHTCDGKGYQAGAGYSVAISYKKGVGVIVGEAGPWNIDDNFWASTSDPQPRRKFADLALGMPEAQAAYFNGYNGGKDQYGRKVTAPFAIDLAFKVGDDIGLPAKKNDWITVSFLWTEDWNAKPVKPNKQSGNSTVSTPAATEEIVPAIKTAAPAADGSITHIVKPGETLWAIATAYNVRIAQIQYLNNMGLTVIIYEGQKLRIREAGPTEAPTGDASSTEIETPSSPPTPAPEPVAASVGTPDHTGFVPQSTGPPSIGTVSATVLPGSDSVSLSTLPPAATNSKSGVRHNGLSADSLLVGGLIFACGGALLFGIGWFFGRRKEDDLEKDA